MSGRLLLRRQLYGSWQDTIQKHYQRQRINSERGLQVFFCASLLAAFEQAGVERRLFVEPRLTTTSGTTGPLPDIVICNTKKIIGVVELKYMPRVVAKTDKDLKTLKWVASHPSCIRISNGRYLGVPRDETEYSLANNAVLCWAGVHRGLDGMLSSRVAKNVHPYFMELHAVTTKDQDPKVISNFRPRR